MEGIRKHGIDYRLLFDNEIRSTSSSKTFLIVLRLEIDFKIQNT